MSVQCMKCVVVAAVSHRLESSLSQSWREKAFPQGALGLSEVLVLLNVL